jgi:hypothetical protein
VSATPGSPEEVPTADLRVPDSSRGVLFAVWRRGEGVILDPILSLGDGRLQKTPLRGGDDGTEETKETLAFAATYYSTGRELTLLLGGRAAGTVRVTSPTDNRGCGSFEAHGFLPRPALGWNTDVALASDRPSWNAGPAGERASSVTRDESLTVSSLIARELKRSGQNLKPVPKATLITTMRALHPHRGSRILTANVSVECFEEKCGGGVLFLVAEADSQGSYMTTLASLLGDHLLDIIDLDGDGVKELVTYQKDYECLEYHVYRKSGDSWVRVHSGGGHCC